MNSLPWECLPTRGHLDHSAISMEYRPLEAHGDLRRLRISGVVIDGQITAAACRRTTGNLHHHLVYIMLHVGG